MFKEEYKKMFDAVPVNEGLMESIIKNAASYDTKSERTENVHTFTAAAAFIKKHTAELSAVAAGIIIVTAATGIIPQIAENSVIYDSKVQDAMVSEAPSEIPIQSTPLPTDIPVAADEAVVAESPAVPEVSADVEKTEAAPNNNNFRKETSAVKQDENILPDKDDRDTSEGGKTSQQTAVPEQAYTAEENSSETNRQGAGTEDTKVEISENEIGTDEDMAESMLNTEVFQAAASADCAIQDNAADTEDMDEDKSVLTQPTVGSSGGSSGSAENGEDISYSESGSYPAGNESIDDSIGSDSAPMASGGGGLQQSASPAAEMEAKSFNITEISKDKAKEQLEGGKHVTVNGIQASIYTVSDEFIRVYYIMDGKGYMIEFEGYTFDEVTNELEDIV